MAPERSSRPGGFGLPSMRNSALATAALTSVALFSQTADAAPMKADEGPSREDVRQRVSSLYDQAESDTGLHNITRAQSAGVRGRGVPASGGRTPDPDTDDITRQWFAGARSSLGPTAPAVLPADRTPARRTPARRAGTPPERAVAPAPAPEIRTGRELEAAARPALELPAGQTQQGPVAELTAAPTAALPAVPGQRQGSSMATPAAAPESKQTSLRSSKRHNQRKIAAASELLYRYTARQTSVAPLTAAPPSRSNCPNSPGLPPPGRSRRSARPRRHGDCSSRRYSTRACHRPGTGASSLPPSTPESPRPRTGASSPTPSTPGPPQPTTGGCSLPSSTPESPSSRLVSAPRPTGP